MKKLIFVGGILLSLSLIGAGCGNQSGPSDVSDTQLETSCSCPSEDLDCSDFSSHSEAQDVFDCCMAERGGDYHRLDRDNDGLACESI